jgi:hypothetical protein
MTIEAYKRYDGQALGSDKIGECSGEEEEKIGDIQALPKAFHKNAYVLIPDFDQIQSQKDISLMEAWKES